MPDGIGMQDDKMSPLQLRESAGTCGGEKNTKDIREIREMT
jgi:hypothetical protein